MKSKSSGSNKEEERKGRPKGSSNDKKSGSGSDDDDDYDISLEEEQEALERIGSSSEDDYVSLSTLSADSLREMESEGLSLEEIQLAVFGEYGIKASLSSLKKRIQDDARDRKFR